MERASWYFRCQSWTGEEQKSQLWEINRVLHWQKIRMHFLRAGVELWVWTAFFSDSGGLYPFVFVHTVSTCAATPIRLRTVKKTTSLEKGTFPHPQWKISELWEGGCPEFGTDDFHSPALSASIFPLHFRLYKFSRSTNRTCIWLQLPGIGPIYVI